MKARGRELLFRVMTLFVPWHLVVAEVSLSDERRPEREIHLSPGRVTTLILPKGEVLDGYALGAPIVEVDADPGGSRLHVSPRAPEGTTNLNLVTSGGVRTLLLRVGAESPDLAVELLPEGTMGEETLGLVPVLLPEDIPVARVLRVLAAARVDPAYAATVPGLTLRRLGSGYRDRGGLVELVEVAQFAPFDLLVFTVRFSNPGASPWSPPRASALAIAAGEALIAPTLWVDGPLVLAAGEVSEVQLMVQGLRLSRENTFAVVPSRGEGRP